MIYLNNYENFTIKMRFKKIYKDMKMYSLRIKPALMAPCCEGEERRLYLQTNKFIAQEYPN